MLRLAGALALAVGAVGLLGYLRVVGKGPFATPAERHLRAMKDRVAAPDSFAPIGFDGMIALPRRRLSTSTPQSSGAASSWVATSRACSAPPAEIHPVTAIEVWDDSTGIFAELAR